MPFPLSIVEAAFTRSGGHCECRRETHSSHQFHPCHKSLIKDSWRSDGTGAWEAAHRTPAEAGGSEALSNCEVLCLPCYRLTR